MHINAVNGSFCCVGFAFTFFLLQMDKKQRKRKSQENFCCC
jgi:hypothetical protein